MDAGLAAEMNSQVFILYSGPCLVLARIPRGGIRGIARCDSIPVRGPSASKQANCLSYCKIASYVLER
jgi:hypothetical protein